VLPILAIALVGVEPRNLAAVFICQDYQRRAIGEKGSSQSTA